MANIRNSSRVMIPCFFHCIFIQLFSSVCGWVSRFGSRISRSPLTRRLPRQPKPDTARTAKGFDLHFQRKIQCSSWKKKVIIIWLIGGRVGSGNKGSSNYHCLLIFWIMINISGHWVAPGVAKLGVAGQACRLRRLLCVRTRDRRI